MPRERRPEAEVMLERRLERSLKGLPNGTIVTDFYSVYATAVTTEPVRLTAEAFLAGLSAEQRTATVYAIDDIEWGSWSKVEYAGTAVLQAEQDKSLALSTACWSTTLMLRQHLLAYDHVSTPEGVVHVANRNRR
jgi:hypothetical protein